MRRYTTFLAWKNQHCQNYYTIQCNLQIQLNPYQIINGIFHRTRRKNLKICMETKKTPNTQSSLENEKWSWRNQVPPDQAILQSYSHQNSMALVQKQTYRSMKEDWSLEINSSTHGQVIYDKGSQTAQWERQFLQQMVLGKQDSCM